jgi:hypothetical protein
MVQALHEVLTVKYLVKKYLFIWNSDFHYQVHRS